MRQAEAAMENNYNTALMIYSSVPPLYKNSARVRNGFQDIMRSRSLLHGLVIQTDGIFRVDDHNIIFMADPPEFFVLLEQ